MKAMDTSKVTIVYVDAEGQEHTQPLSDIFEVGVLIDDEGDDMEAVRVEVEMN